MDLDLDLDLDLNLDWDDLPKGPLANVWLELDRPSPVVCRKCLLSPCQAPFFAAHIPGDGSGNHPPEVPDAN